MARLLVALVLGFVLGLALLTSSPARSADLAAHMLSQVGSSRPRACPSRWCACYLGQALRRVGRSPLRTNLARDYARWGRPAAPRSLHSVMVMRSHVGVVVGTCPGGRVRLVSGNHSRRVGVGCYSAGRAIAWRR